MMTDLQVPTNVIFLKRQKGYWHSIVDLDPVLKHWFDSNEIPTQFREEVPEDFVYDWIQKHNPDKFVMVIV